MKFCLSRCTSDFQGIPQQFREKLSVPGRSFDLVSNSVVVDSSSTGVFQVQILDSDKTYECVVRDPQQQASEPSWPLNVHVEGMTNIL